MIAVALAAFAVSVPASASALTKAGSPDYSRNCPKTRSGWNSRVLIGKPVVRARRIAVRHNCSIRVTRRNGKDRVVTSDYVNRRINVAIRGEKRRVVRILRIG